MTNSKKNPCAFVRVKDLPQTLGVSRSTVRRMITSGEIRTSTYSKQCVGVTQAELKRLLKGARLKSAHVRRERFLRDNLKKPSTSAAVAVATE